MSSVTAQELFNHICLSQISYRFQLHILSAINNHYVWTLNDNITQARWLVADSDQIFSPLSQATAKEGTGQNVTESGWGHQLKKKMTESMAVLQ